MKSTSSKFAASLQTSVYPQTVHQPRPHPKAAGPDAKPMPPRKDRGARAFKS